MWLACNSRMRTVFKRIALSHEFFFQKKKKYTNASKSSLAESHIFFKAYVTCTMFEQLKRYLICI